jgi:DNA recombination protein RmuC
MVVLFLPGEHFLSAALERRPDMLDAALTRKVLIATPVTLVSVLKGVAYGWRQEKLAKNAEELRRIAGEFHERVRTFGEVYVESGRHLQKAMEAYNKSVGSWDTRLLPSLKRMQELGVGTTTPQPVQIDLPIRVARPVDKPIDEPARDQKIA